MSGTGYASVGHLFEHCEDQTEFGYKQVLRKLVSELYVDEDAACGRQGFGNFERFFDNIPISVETTSKYLANLLKLPNVENSTFELKVERMVWDLIQLDPKFEQVLRNSRNPEEKKEERMCFQLFCLFNRFCDIHKIPMKMNEKAVKFLLQKVGIPIGKNKSLPHFPFQNLLECVFRHKQVLDELLTVAVEHAYDEYVRDILIEKTISFRTFTTWTPGGSQKITTGPCKKKLASLSSSYLKIYEDEPDYPSNMDVPNKREPTTAVIIEMPVAFITMDCCIINVGTFQSIIKEGLSLNTCTSNTGVDLLFDLWNEHDDYLAWEKAIVEAQETNRRKLNKLQQARNTISLLTSLNSLKSSEYAQSRVPTETELYGAYVSDGENNYDNEAHVDTMFGNLPSVSSQLMKTSSSEDLSPKKTSNQILPRLLANSNTHKSCENLFSRKQQD